MWWKLTTGRWLGLIIEIAVFALVFKLLGGTMAGVFRPWSRRCWLACYFRFCSAGATPEPCHP